MLTTAPWARLRALTAVLAGAALACGQAVDSRPSSTPSNGRAAPAGDAKERSAAASACGLVGSPGTPTSPWAATTASGSLSYATVGRGDHLLDFSYAGYMGGGVALPAISVQRTVRPSGGDDTGAIQSAIDAVSALATSSGLRGAVLLAPGTFGVSGPLSIRASGVVLRGSGSGSGGTLLKLSGDPRTAVSIAGQGSCIASGRAAIITDAYLPAGSRTFHVDSTNGFAAGDAVHVDRPVTDAWIHFMGMDTLARDGRKQTWLRDTTVIHSDRVVTAIAGTAVTIDAPLSDSLDQAYVTPPGATLVHFTFVGRIDRVGIESLAIAAPKQATVTNGQGFSGIDVDATIDGFVRDVALSEFTSGITIGDGAKWITVEDTSITRTAPVDDSAGYPFQISVSGQQTLVQRVRTAGDDAFSYATQARTPGPNVVLGLTATGRNSPLQPHQRWATGLLVDGADASAIELSNRGTYGSGHGWAIGFGVVWNSRADSFVVQYPPGAPNWIIGSTGTYATRATPGTSATPPGGVVDARNQPVTPKSLYLAQLCLRLGPQAVTNIGYATASP